MYDLSKEYLVANAKTVAQLHELWNGKTPEFTFKTPDARELRGIRYKLNNLIASMEENVVDYRGIRQKLRTWTTRDGDFWVLHVGPNPPKNISGRVGPKDHTLQAMATSTTVASEGSERTFNKVVADLDSWQGFQLWAAGMLDYKEVTVLKAEFKTPISSLEAFNGLKEIGWEPSVVSPTTIKLERKG